MSALWPTSLEGMLAALAGLCAVAWVGLRWASPGLARVRRMCAMSIGLIGLLLVTRSWFVEPFFVPSASMVPTLEVGDVLLVQKFPYRLIWPVTDTTLRRVASPSRGDVIVFWLPNRPNTRYAKRVIGLPGDDVLAVGERWWVNGEPLVHTPSGRITDTRSGEGLLGRARLEERLAGRRYATVEDRPSLQRPHARHWRVPAGQLFVLGDNRGMSRDSRDFGFVDEDRLVGRVGRVLFNTRRLDRWFLPGGG